MNKSAYKNILEDSTVTLSAGTENAAFPLYRLYDRNPGKKFKSTLAETIKIDIDQGSAPVAVDRLLITKGHNLSELNGVLIFPSSFTITNGLLEPGSVKENVQNADQVYYQVNEVAGTPGLLFEAEFTGIPQQLSGVHFVGRYEGNPAHEVWLEVWNYTLAQWDRVTAETTDFPSGGVDYNADFTIGGTLSDYYTGAPGNETLKLRFNHPDPGNANHDFFIDYLALGDGFEIIVQHSDDDITYTDAVICTPQDCGCISCDFASSTHKYWRVILNTPELIPELGELFLTETYEWARNPHRPFGAFENVKNEVVALSSSGSQRGIIMGDDRAQRPYVFRILEAQKDEFIALWNFVGTSVPFWVFDGTLWYFVSFREPPNFIEESVETFTNTLNLLEVIDG